MTDRPRILVLAGPTAAGKTSLALGVAERLNGEIISADAVAVYKGLDIGADVSIDRDSGYHIRVRAREPDGQFYSRLRFPLALPLQSV